MKKYFTLLAALLFSIQTAFCQYVWTQKTSMSMARYIGCGLTIGNKSYVGTGFNSNAIALSDWWEYDAMNDSWTQKSSLPSARASASAFAINGKGYVGLGSRSSLFLTDFYEYDPVSNLWAQKASLPSAGRFGAASFAIGNIGYICCGNLGSASGPYSNQLFAYDATSNTWSSKAAFPGTVRYGGRGEAVNNMGYVTGGINGVGNSSSSFYNDLWEYNPNTNSWAQKPSIPGLGRQYPSTFVMDGKFVVGTGIHWTGFLVDFYAFDPIANSWSTLPSLPPNEARWSAVGFSDGNSGYVVSGNQSFNNPIVITNNLWKLSLSTSLSEPASNSNIQFQLYPTLASDYIRLIFKSPVQNKYRVMVTNTSGQVCFDGQLINGETELNTSQLSQGMYVVFVMDDTDKKVGVQKFVIDRH